MYFCLVVDHKILGVDRSTTQDSLDKPLQVSCTFIGKACCTFH